LPISPLEGEMSPKATEGVADPCGTTPSGLPAISPSRGEIGSSSMPRHQTPA
ncbi:MAG: pyruvate dehydrogenase complex dihydrolipoamide acetyltransferase, partial [Mesorhizobium sp.]